MLKDPQIFLTSIFFYFFKTNPKTDILGPGKYQKEQSRKLSESKKELKTY